MQQNIAFSRPSLTALQGLFHSIATALQGLFHSIASSSHRRSYACLSGMGFLPPIHLREAQLLGYKGVCIVGQLHRVHVLHTHLVWKKDNIINTTWTQPHGKGGAYSDGSAGQLRIRPLRESILFQSRIGSGTPEDKHHHNGHSHVIQKADARQL